MPQLGAHLATAGGWYRALEAAQTLGCEAVQIFLQAPGRWAPPRKNPDAVARFYRSLCAANLRGRVFAHVPYLVNLASENPVLAQQSVALVADELLLGATMGLAGVVLHPGSAGQGHREAAIARFRERLGEVFTLAPAAPPLLLENTAGAGGLLGARMEELHALGEGFWGQQGKLGLCLDTAHLWAAGYDLRNGGWGQVLAELEALGLASLVRLVHCNDTPAALGSRRDRHASPGEGQLGAAFFAALLKDPLVADLPCIMEIPPGPKNMAVREALARLRSWLAPR